MFSHHFSLIWLNWCITVCHQMDKINYSTIHPTAEVSEDVNRILLTLNITVQLSTSYTSPDHQNTHCHWQTDRQTTVSCQCEILNFMISEHCWILTRDLCHSLMHFGSKQYSSSVHLIDRVMLLKLNPQQSGWKSPLSWMTKSEQNVQWCPFLSAAAVRNVGPQPAIATFAS